MCTTDDSNIYNFRSCCCCNNGKIICDYRQAVEYICICVYGEAYPISQIPYPQSNVTLRKTSRRQSVRTTRKNYKPSALVFVNFRLNKHISKTQKKSQQKL